MDNKAIKIVEEFVKKELLAEKEFEVYITWKCKTLQNWKWMISTNISDGMYYEVTFNGDKNEFYLDAYVKTKNVVVSGETTGALSQA